MSDLKTLIADGNSSAARRARVKLQPRDKKGRWVPTGAALLAAIRGLNGVAKKYKLKAIGGTATKKGEKNKIRALLTQDAPDLGLKKNTVLEVDPKNGELDTGIKLNKDFLRKKGIDPDLQHTLPKSMAEQPQDVADMNPQEADDLDIELADGGLNDKEDKDFRAERDQEPLAKLPPGMEAVEGEDVADLLDEAPEDTARDGEDPAELDGPFEEALIHDAMAEGFYGGEPDLDSIISEAQSKPEEVPLTDLKPGDVISLGKQGNKRVAEVKPVGDQGEVELYVDDNGRIAKAGRFPGNAGVSRVRKAEDAPKRPASEKPEKPKAPRKPVDERPEPEPTPEPETKAPVEPAAARRKMDNGQLIKQQRFSEEELKELRNSNLENLIGPDGEAKVEYNSKGKAYNPKDPNAMMNFLANAYKNSKFDENGHLVLMREVSRENGKRLQWEIKAAILGDKKIGYMFKFKDLNTGEEETVLHYDGRDSMTSLFGKTNSPQMLADILTGKESRTYNKNFITDVHANDPKERAHYFTLQGRTKSIEDTTKYYANGYAERINYSDGTLLNKEVKGVFDGYKENDLDAVGERLRAVFGRVPADQESHDIVMATLRGQFAEKFPGEDKRSFGALVTSASNFYRKTMFADENARVIPYSSTDKVTPVEVGDVVEYENNIGEKSIVRVSARQRSNFANPVQSDDNFGYGDYVTITDANGNRSSIPTTNLRILKDQNTELTEFKGRVSGRQLREERGMLYNPTTLRFPGQNTVPDKVGPIDDVVPGDNLYGKDGSNLGVIIESVPIVGKDDKKGYGVLYMNKEGELRKVAIAAGEERGPKIVTSNADTVPQKTRTVEADVAESDPDFDLDSIVFETDPDSVERPKTVGLDFNVPANSKRNAEQQLALNDLVQREIDEMASGLSNKLGDTWTYDASSFNAKSFFTSGELAKLVEQARSEYPDLTDSEIRTLLELKHSKQRGFFGMTKEKMIDNILQEAAIFRKGEGGVQDLRVDIKRNKSNNTIELAVSDSDLEKYMSAVEGVDKFINSNPQLKSLVDGSDEGHYIRIVDSPSTFQALYNSIGRTWSNTAGVLGVNISSPRAGEPGKWDTAILINHGSLASGSKPAGDFGDAEVHTFVHEFGHTIGNKLARLSGGGSRLGDNYSEAAKDFITSYGKKSKDEHFADSFAKWVMTGEAAPAFLDFLKSFDIIDSVDLG